MATIGRRAPSRRSSRLHLSGLLAWLAWLFVHIWYLIGYRNRLVVMITWAWSYVTYRRGARLITGYAAPGAEQALRTGARVADGPSQSASLPETRLGGHVEGRAELVGSGQRLVESGQRPGPPTPTS